MALVRRYYMSVELKMAGLTLNGKLIGYRIKYCGEFFDVDLETLGMRIPTQGMKTIPMFEQNGVYTTTMEQKGAKIEDLSEYPATLKAIKGRIRMDYSSNLNKSENKSKGNSYDIWSLSGKFKANKTVDFTPIVSAHINETAYRGIHIQSIYIDFAQCIPELIPEKAQLYYNYEQDCWYLCAYVNTEEGASIKVFRLIYGDLRVLKEKFNRVAKKPTKLMVSLREHVMNDLLMQTFGKNDIDICIKIASQPSAMGTQKIFPYSLQCLYSGDDAWERFHEGITSKTLIFMF